MGFLDVGIGEIILILVVALIIWGPGRIPEIARTMGRVMYNLRKATFDLTSQVTKEIDGEEKSSPPQPRGGGGGKNKKSSDVGKTRLQRRDDQSKVA
jgi:sec-independent protein translocase protein TatA